MSMNVFIFLCCLLAVIFGSTENVFGYVVEDVSEEIPPVAPVSGNLSCTSQQTECELGCCPYPNAVCCTDGYECCPEGKVCVSYVGICIGLENEQNKELALVSSKTTPVENIRTPCPSGTTTCGPNRCCPFPDGVCCLDGEHCCPNGYRCDISKQQCIKNSNDIYTTFNVPATSTMKSFEPFKTVKEDAYKSCPGGTKQCPSYTSCCLKDDNVWSCCPNPKSLQYQKKGVNLCCMTAMGYICCPFGCNYYFGCV